MIIECIIELNWLCKPIKKVKSSQIAILVLNWVFFPVSIVKFRSWESRTAFYKARPRNHLDWQKKLGSRFNLSFTLKLFPFALQSVIFLQQKVVNTPKMLLIELFVMQDYKVQHPLKQIQIILYLWQHIMTMAIIRKKLKKSVVCLMIYNHIT